MAKSYEKRLNLAVDLRNPNYKRAYEYIMEHPRGKFRFICDCVLQVMDGKGVTEQREIQPLDSQQMLESLLNNPYWMESFARAVAQYLPNIEMHEKEETTWQGKQNQHPNEEEKNSSVSYDGPILDSDMMLGISAWENLME